MHPDAVDTLDGHLDAIAEHVAAVMEIRVGLLGAEQSQKAARQGYALAHQVEALKLHLLRGVEDTSTQPGGSAGFLTDLRIDPRQAKADVLAARMTDPTVSWDGVIGGLSGDRGVLARTGALLASGVASRAHLDLAIKAVTSIPTQLRRGTITMHVRDEDGTERVTTPTKTDLIDGLIADKARLHAPRGLRRITEELLTTLDPDRADRDTDPDGYARRSVRWTRHHGMTTMTVDLDTETAIFVRQAITAYSAPTPEVITDDGEVVRDDRSQGQREFDGFVDLMTRGAGTGPAALVDTATVTVVVDASTLPTDTGDTGDTGDTDTSDDDTVGEPVDAVVDGHGPVTRSVFESLACAGSLRALIVSATGEPLALSPTRRLADRNQRIALGVRDGGCAAPGCEVQPALCHAHHIVFFSNGGPTTMDNLVLLCPRHHRAVHADHLQVRLDEHQQSWARWTSLSTRWPGLSPHGPWVRNTLPDDLADARHLGRRLG